MAAHPEVAAEEVAESSHIVKMGEGSELRKVEKDVLIPKIMKKHAMERCSDYVKAFEDCARGRLISVTWACQEPNKEMQNCLQSLYKDKAFQEECTNEYLNQRENFRKTGIKTSSRSKKTE